SIYKINNQKQLVMPLTANDPNRKSWIEVDKNSDFPIQNIPFGVFLTNNHIVTVGTRIGDYAIDLSALYQIGYFDGIDLTDDIFKQDTLNAFISKERKTRKEVRNRIAEIFEVTNPKLRNNESHRKLVLFHIDVVEMHQPVCV